MMTITRFCLFVFLSAASVAGALVAGPARLVGTVKSFDAKLVVVETKTAKFEVPREFVGDRHFTVGENVELLFSLEQADKIHSVKKPAER